MVAEPIVNGLKKQYSDRVTFETVKADDDYEMFAEYQEEYGFQGVPTVVVIDSSGKVILEETGVIDEKAYEKKLTEALEKAGG